MGANSYSSQKKGSFRQKGTAFFKKTGKRMKETDPFKYWKWILLAFALIFGKKLLSSIFDGDGKFFGINFSGATDYEDSANSGTPGNTGGFLAGDQQNSGIPLSIQNLVDEIHVKLMGYNAYSYPEVINRIANLTQSEVWNCITYWNSKYKSATGFTLYHFINDEWTGNNWIDGYLYEPALSKIEGYGWKDS